MIRIAIVEDNDSHADILKEYLFRYQSENQVAFQVSRFKDGSDIAEPYQGDWDVIFLDIEMALMDGMQAAATIRQRDEAVELIFVTNLAQYAIQGYKVRALDYILKPITYASFEESLRRALRNIQKNPAFYLSVPQKQGTEKVNASKVLWVESHGHQLSFHLKDRIVSTTVYSMKEMEEVLAPHGFARCHSAYLVNLDRVSGFREEEVFVEGVSLPISRGKKGDFMKALIDRMDG